MNLRKLAFLATALFGGFATSANAYSPEPGGSSAAGNPYAYLFEHHRRAEPKAPKGPYDYLFQHRYPESRESQVNRTDLFTGEPDTLR